MCGISGFFGVSDSYKRLMLTIGLASGIDTRGGHAAGFVSISKEGLRYARRRGEWGTANMRFFKAAAQGDICMMHARYATCGTDSVRDAHPFAIKREGKVVLWGAHNGVIYDAWESAIKHNREITVDSQEIFELIADRNYAGINNMNGYGVITWISADSPNHVKLTRLSNSSEICVVSLKEGGIVWGSTRKIIDRALEVAELNAKQEWAIDDIGQVYEIHSDKIYFGDDKGLSLAKYSPPTRMAGSMLGRYLSKKQKEKQDEQDAEMMALWEKWLDDDDIKEELKSEGV